MRVGVVELNAVWEDPAANRDQVAARLGDADLTVFPELTFTGFTMNAVPDAAAEPFLRKEARRAGQAVVAGYVGEGPSNVAVAVDQGGSVLARYRKLHPFSYAGEDRHYRPGNTLPVFDLHGFRAALFVCYDLRFPEAFREAALRGADLMIVIANWPEPRREHWRTLLRARAIENQTYVVGVNRVGSDPEHAYRGDSLVVDPLGEVLLEGEGCADLDPRTVARLRARFPALRDVRLDRYRFGPRDPEPEGIV